MPGRRALQGKRAAGLPAAAYGGKAGGGDGPPAAGKGAEGLKVPQDVREAWEERAAIMMYEGHLPCTEAEHLAWPAHSAHGTKR